MDDRDQFLSSTIPRQVRADTSLHNGDAAPRREMWSRNDPVTLFGAAQERTGWDDVSRTFDWLASIFSDCTAFDLELVAADVHGDLAYTVGYENTTASVEGAQQSYRLRVTHIYRRENGEWKIVHRHADPLGRFNLPPVPGKR